MATIKEKLKKIKKLYPKVSKEKFFYRKPTDFKQSSNAILAYMLIHDMDIGYTIVDFRIYRKTAYDFSWWVSFDNEKLQSAFIDGWINSVNASKGRSYRFITFIGWRYDDKE